jgi:hypothetical protein
LSVRRARSAALIARAALAITGAACEARPLSGATFSEPVFATSVEQSGSGLNTTISVTPWPFEQSVAYLCARTPGNAFKGPADVPPAAAGCIPLDAVVADDRLDLHVSPAGVTRELLFEIARTPAPWYLAVAGSRGPVSAGTVVTLHAPPALDGPGPSL